MLLETTLESKYSYTRMLISNAFLFCYREYKRGIHVQMEGRGDYASDRQWHARDGRHHQRQDLYAYQQQH